MIRSDISESKLWVCPSSAVWCILPRQISCVCMLQCLLHVHPSHCPGLAANQQFELELLRFHAHGHPSHARLPQHAPESSAPCPIRKPSFLSPPSQQLASRQ